MSEQAKEAPEGKKKKGKMPLIIIAVLLAGGGFFGMKMKGGGEKKKEPEVKLGAIVEIKDEFLTNMAERTSYVRTKISLQVKDGFDGKGLEKEMAAIQDVINMRLQSTSVRSVSTLEGLRKLKKDMAIDINKLLAEAMKKDKKESEDEDSDKKKKKKKKKKHEDEEEDEEEAPEIPPGWDSAEGPVLKILFVSFATQ